MTTFAARFPAALARLSRRRDGRLVAGVCAGLARSARVDPTLVRLVFVLVALAGGAGLVAYGGAVLALPVEGGSVTRRRRIVGAALLLVAGGLTLRAVGLSDSVLWPALLVAVGVYLLQSNPGARRRARRAAGVLLIALGAGIFVDAVSGGSQGSVASAGLFVGLCLVAGPWIWRLVQERDAERLARIRVEERAEMAARVHDSVLQTLALVQRSADDPKRVAALARRQERELRGWLYGGAAAGETLRSALEDALADVEEVHGVRVEIVQTGDLGLDERVAALVLATREAVTNAAVHAGVDDVSVFVEAGDAEAAVFVRDRGSGFDPAAVAPGRRGIADSIEGRLARHGGRATIRTTAGEGTEVELRLPFPGGEEATT